MEGLDYGLEEGYGWDSSTSAARSSFKQISVSGNAKAHIGHNFNKYDQTYLYINPNLPPEDTTDIRLRILPVAIPLANFIDFAKDLLEKGEPMDAHTESTLDKIIDSLDVLDQNMEDSRAFSEKFRSSALTELGKECKELHESLRPALIQLREEQSVWPWRNLMEALVGRWGHNGIQRITKRLVEVQRRLSRLITVHVCFHIERHLSVLDKMQREAKNLQIPEATEPRSLLDNIAKTYIGIDSRATGSLTTSLLDLEHKSDRGVSISPRLHSDDFKKLFEILEKLDQSMDLATSNHAFLKSLYFSKIDARWTKIPEAHAKTFEWIFTDNVVSRGHKTIGFTDWLRHGTGIYWIRGKPGSGKSTLMKFICSKGLDRVNNCLRLWAGDNSRLLTPKYFFWIAGTRLQKSISGLLQSLLLEILRALPEIIPEACASAGELPNDTASDGVGWRSANLRKALRNVIKMCKGQGGFVSTKFCFFIDGIDELEKTEGEDETHVNLIDTIVAISELPGVKICVSSRPWAVFEGLENSKGILRLEDLTLDDMRKYAKEQLDTDKRYQELYFESQEYRDFINEVTEKANGVFLWVRLVIRDLLQQGFPETNTTNVLRRRLGNFHKDLVSFFMETLKRIERENLPRAARIFWMATEVQEPQLLMTYSFLDKLPFTMDCSHHNLQTMSEGEVMWHKEQMKKRLDESSGGLLEVVEDEPDMGPFFRYKVDYIHRTVRDFLKQPSTSELLPPEQRFNGLEGYGWLAPCVAIVEVIRTAPFERNQSQIAIRLLKDLLFFAHQAEENQCDRNGLRQVLMVAEKAYLAAKQKFNLVTETNLALGLACQAKVMTFVENKPAKDLRSPSEPRDKPPLSYALELAGASQPWQVHPEVVSLLLDKGADPNRWCGERWSPWQEFVNSVYQNSSLANDMRIRTAMRYLLNRGADMSTHVSELRSESRNVSQASEIQARMVTVEAAIKKISDTENIDLCSQSMLSNTELATALEGKRVIVIGAGVAGLSFVIGLRKQWPTHRKPPIIAIYDSRVAHEPYQGYEEDRGILLTGPTAGTACEALRSLGLLEEALTCAILENTGLEDTDEVHYPAKSTSLYGHLEQDVVSTRDRSVPEQKLVDYDGSKLEVPRRIYYSDLHKILVKAAKRTDEIFWGVTAQNIIEQRGERIGVWLTANKDEHGYFSRCDYVIAADGASSTTRACLLSRSTPMMAKHQVGGVATFPGGIPRSLQTWGTRMAKDWVDHTPFCSYYAVDEHHVIWDVNSAEPLGDPNDLDDLEESKWVLELCDKKVSRMITTNSKKERLMTLFENTHPRAVFSFAGGEKRTFSNISDRAVVFIGDSNHVTPKGYANRGSLALADGWDLAEGLARPGDVNGAIKAYRDASAARASRELGFWGQGALNMGLGGIVSVFSTIRLVGNLFLLFLKSD